MVLVASFSGVSRDVGGSTRRVMVWATSMWFSMSCLTSSSRAGASRVRSARRSVPRPSAPRRHCQVLAQSRRTDPTAGRSFARGRTESAHT